MIHGQFTRRDQVPELKRLGIFPALYPLHTFYWGDWHRDSVAGPERAREYFPDRLDDRRKHAIHNSFGCARDIPQLNENSG